MKHFKYVGVKSIDRDIKEGSLLCRIAWFFNIERFTIVTTRTSFRYKGKELFNFEIPIWLKIIRCG